MSTEMYACDPDDDIHTALKTLRREKVHRLPVIDSDGELQGIVSMNDVVLHAEHAHGKKAPDLTYDDVVSTFKPRSSVSTSARPTSSRALPNASDR
jgi:CBS domain-containing protein